MANTYKNIVITPNSNSAVDDPKIVFSGANTTTNTDITVKVYPTSNGMLSFEGSAGQLFSITNDLTGTIFSVNDMSGLPAIEVIANGDVRINQYTGNVGIGNATPTNKLSVNGDALINTALTIGNSTVKTFINSSSMTIGNSTANAFVNSSLVVAKNISANLSITTTNTTAYGLSSLILNGNGDVSANSTLNSAYSIITRISNFSKGNTTGNGIGSAYGLYNQVQTRGVESANIGTGYGIYNAVGPIVDAPNLANGSFGTAYSYYSTMGQASSNATITTAYHLYGTYVASSNVGTKWGIYLDNESKSYFSGNVGIGNTAPTHKLSVNGDALINTQITIGNATVNVIANSSVIKVVNSSINSTAIVANALIQVSNATLIANLTPNALTIGNSVVNATHHVANTLMQVSNATAIANLSPVALTIGNSVVNTTVLFANTLVQVQNSTAIANLSPVQLKIGTTVVNTTHLSANVLVIGGNTQLAGNDSSYVSIGSGISTSAKLYVNAIGADFSGQYNIYGYTLWPNTAMTGSRTYGAGMFYVQNINEHKNAGNTQQYGPVVLGIQGQVNNGNNAGTADAQISLAAGVQSVVYNYANGALSNSVTTVYAYRGLIATVNPNGGTIGTAYGLYSNIAPYNTSAQGNIGTVYGIYSQIGLNSTNASSGTGTHFYGNFPASANVTTKWGLYLTGEDKNYLSGNVGIGNTVPTTKLSVNGDMLVNTQITVGNATVNSFVNSSLVQVKNAGSTANLSPGNLVIGNSVVNTTAMVANALIQVSNATLMANLTPNSLKIANSTVNATVVVVNTYVQVANDVAVANLTPGSLIIGNTTIANASITANTFVYNDKMNVTGPLSGTGKIYGITYTNTDSISIGFGTNWSHVIQNTVVTGAKTFYGDYLVIQNDSEHRAANGTQLTPTFYGHQTIMASANGNPDALGGTMTAYNADVRHSANGAVTNNMTSAVGFNATIRTLGVNTGNLVAGVGVYSTVAPSSTSSGNIETGYAFRTTMGVNSANGIIGTGYQIFASYVASANVTTKWGLYIDNETKNYFSGFVGIANTVPTTRLAVQGDAYVSNAILVGQGTTNSFVNGSLIQLQNTTSIANLTSTSLILGATVVNTTTIVANTIQDSMGNVRTRALNDQSAGATSYITLAADANKMITSNAGTITVNGSLLSVGQTIIFYNTNTTTNTVIAGGTGLTLLVSGSGVSGSKNLVSYGKAEGLMVSANVVVLSGSAS